MYTTFSPVTLLLKARFCFLASYQQGSFFFSLVFFLLLFCPKFHCNCSDHWGDAMPFLALASFTKGDDWSHMTDLGREVPFGIILWLFCTWGTTERPESLRLSPSIAFVILLGNMEWEAITRGWLTMVDGVGSTRWVIPTVSPAGTQAGSPQGRPPGSRKVGRLSWTWN